MDSDTQGFDYVVVGAGSAGCVVARRLLETTDATVLVLEAGGTPDGIESISDPIRYSPSPHTLNRPIFLSRGKVLGSGSTNPLVWHRGDRSVYDRWAAAGNPGWDYESVLPYFRRSEDWEDGASAQRGAGGPMPIERARDLHPVASALIDAGLSFGMPYLDDINVAEPAGVGPLNTNVRDGVHVSPWTGYLEPLRDHERLTLLTGAHVTGLTFDGSQCTGVEYVRGGHRVTARATTEVVLTAGAIDTPRLLLLSGIGDAAELITLGLDVMAHVPGVGRNLQEHPILGGLCFAPSEPMPPNDNLEGAVAFWRSNSGLALPDLVFLGVQLPLVSPEVGAAYSPPADAFTIAPALGGVRSTGRLRLTGAAPDAPLDIQPNLLADPADVAALVAGVEIGLELAGQPAYAKLIDRWVAPPRRFDRAAIEEFVRLAATPFAQPAGTCAMGPGADAVVDHELRVHGIDGLRVADASVMPAITTSFTHAATIMIAERAADLLAH